MDDARRSLLPPYAAGTSPASAAGARSSAKSKVTGSRRRKHIAGLRSELRREQYAENKAWRHMKITHAILGDYGDSSVIDQWYARAMAIRHLKNQIKALCESPTKRRKRMT